MTDILITGKNKLEIDGFLKQPSHALLIVGPAGYGKYSLARYIASQLLLIDSVDQLDKYPYFSEIKPENKLISVDKIRQLKKLFLLKTTGQNNIRRVIIVEDAGTMNEEAQNALLKILEEPPEDSILILTASNQNKLRGTVLSRVQTIKIHKHSLDETAKFFSGKGYPDDDIRKNYIFTNGSIGLISSLLGGDSNQEHISYINDAKSLLTANLVNKLLAVDNLSKDKDSLDSRLYALKQVVRTALLNSLEKDDIKLANRWIKALKAIQASENNIARGANTKLLLTNLALQL